MPERRKLWQKNILIYCVVESVTDTKAGQLRVESMYIRNKKDDEYSPSFPGEYYLHKLNAI